LVRNSNPQRLKILEQRLDWLENFGRDSQSILIVDYISPPGYRAQLYLRSQFLPQIPFGTPNSRILSKYHNKLHTTNPYMQIIRAKINDPSQSVVVYVDYSGRFAVPDSSIKSRVDPGDVKFVMAAINFITHHVMGPRFRRTIVYADDIADWLACRLELENDYHINFFAPGIALTEAR
jgi:hypothetical protein